jgi:type I restriction enzyme M protein
MTDSRPNLDFIFRVTNEVLWNTFKKNEIGDVMLPFMVLRRLDCVLEPKKKAVRDAYLKFKDQVNPDKLAPVLKKAAGNQNFYNTSQYDLRALTQDPQNIEINFRNYINGYSNNVSEILENFQLDKVVARLVKNNLLYKMVQAISEVDLHLDTVSNHDMGYIFEELIRIANEQSNETAGEHFTPREVIRLMVNILFSTEKDELKNAGIIRTVYDPACGTGGMLTISKNHILENINAKATIQIYGQEINEQAYAIAKSDLLITGENPDNIRHGNTFIEDRFPDKKFNYMLANPPYGVSWKINQDAIKNEAFNPAGRFTAGLPRSSDGQLLFVQHMISKMENAGARISIVTSGSPLFTGDAGSGESEIRRWIIENDWLDCLIALPGELFYNTGITTYIWIISNKKQKQRKGKVQLINAAEFCKPMKKSLNNKRKYITEEHIKEITNIYTAYKESDVCKIFPNDHFGYVQVTVEQPELKNGKPVKDKNDNPKADSKKRDTENIPLAQDIEEYFKREVLPHVPNAWIDYDKTRIGYEINFTKYFYLYTKPEASSEIKTKIISLEKDIDRLLKEVLND